MYKVAISNMVEKALDKLPGSVFLKIDQAIQALKESPRPVGCVKLTDTEGYRIRVGDYRLLYKIDDNILNIYIFRVAHRKDVYKKR